MTTDIAEMYTTYHWRIVSFIEGRIRNGGSSREIAEDLAQETFRKALEAIKRGVIVHNPLAWLYRIARNLIIDYWRNMGRMPDMMELDALIGSDGDDDDTQNKPYSYRIAAEGLTPHELAEQATIVERVRHRVARLPEAQAAVVTYRMHGYDLDEIAIGLGKNYTAVKQLQLRAHANLRNTLQSEAA